MTETTDQPEPAEPWAAVVGDWDVPGMLPGHVAHLQRIEAAEAAEERRVEAERADRADARQTLALWEARQYALHRGLPWDPAKPFAHMPTVVQRADMMFAHQDLAARQADFRAAQEAGLVHLLHGSPGPATPPSPTGLTSAPETAARSKRVKLKARIARVLTSPAASRHDKHPLSTNGQELYR